MENKKWKLLFVFLFVIYTIISCVYASKSLIISQKSTKEKIDDGDGFFHEGYVTRTYNDNYAAIGGAIAFGVMGAASLIAFSIISLKEKDLSQ